MLIRNVMTSTAPYPVDIRVCDGRIADIGPRLPHLDGEIVDASGLIATPGGVDAHTHLEMNMGQATAADDFTSGTVAAACGGVTAIIDHPGFGPSGCPLDTQIRLYHDKAKGKAVIDYGFHGVIQHVDETVLRDMDTLAAEGITSFKLYLTYQYKISDGDVLRVLERCRELGLLLCVHCENDGVITLLRERFVRTGKTAPIYHALSRPPACEAEAVERMLWLASLAGHAPLYVVHLSTAEGLHAIRRARERGQKNIFAETCPQYLYLDETRYLAPDGLKYVMSPPLRPPLHGDALWGGLSDGSIDVVGTDHCPFNFAGEKQWGAEDFTKTPNGAPGIETRMPLLFSETVAGRLTLPQFEKLCCETPARLFGLYPHKGVLATGADADIVLWDPSAQGEIRHRNLHENVDYTPYEGLSLHGKPVMTMARGEVIVREGQFVGERGRGRFLSRLRGGFTT